MSDRKVVGGLVTSIALAVFAIWLLITFWKVFLIAGAAVLVVGLGWYWISWWLVAGRINHQTGRAIRQSNAAYERARGRMERIARTYRGWR
jgi:hypothetical protein